VLQYPQTASGFVLRKPKCEITWKSDKVNNQNLPISHKNCSNLKIEKHVICHRHQVTSKTAHNMKVTHHCCVYKSSIFADADSSLYCNELLCYPAICPDTKSIVHMSHIKPIFPSIFFSIIFWNFTSHLLVIQRQKYAVRGKMNLLFHLTIASLTLSLALAQSQRDLHKEMWNDHKVCRHWFLLVCSRSS
jgi:hypothetical protein